MDAVILSEMLLVPIKKNTRHQIAEYLRAKMKYRVKIIHLNVPISVFYISSSVHLPIGLSNLIAAVSLISFHIYYSLVLTCAGEAT